MSEQIRINLGKRQAQALLACLSVGIDGVQDAVDDGTSPDKQWVADVGQDVFTKVVSAQRIKGWRE